MFEYYGFWGLWGGYVKIGNGTAYRGPVAADTNVKQTTHMYKSADTDGNWWRESSRGIQNDKLSMVNFYMGNGCICKPL